jgi:tetratricopeptide (TPR) repeat protein
LSIEPKEKSALTNRSVAYTELGAYALAIDDVNIVIESDPNNALAINNRGYAYEKMGDIAKSIEDYDFACKLGVDVSCSEASRLRQTLSR